MREDRDVLRTPEEREEFLKRLDRFPDVQNRVNARDATNALFSLAYATLGGAALVFASSFVNTTSYSDYALEDRISRGCFFWSLRIRTKLFNPLDLADSVRGALSELSPDQMGRALEKCRDLVDDPDNLKMVRVPKSPEAFSVYKLQLNYALSGLITSISQVPEDKNFCYLLH